MTPTREPSVTANEAAKRLRDRFIQLMFGMVHREEFESDLDAALRTERLRVVEQVRAQGHPAGCTVSGCHLESAVAGLTGEEPSGG